MSNPSMNDQQPIRFLITGGGTGGHLFPAVATAERMCARVPGTEVLFIGTRRRLDKTHLERYGFSVKTIHSYGLKGKNLPALLKALAMLPVSLIEAGYHILRFKPGVVCGVGGYVTGPVIGAARLLGKPTIIHEQNSVPGLANRKLGAFVERICLSLPDTLGMFPASKTTLTGNPVRNAIVEASLARNEHDGRIKTILVLGGSQGARAVNQLVVEAFTTDADLAADYHLIHQTGREDESTVQSSYDKAGLKAEVSAFFDDMADVYKRADLVVSRAGATTLAELAVMGLPAILIPYPYAADNHQEKKRSKIC